MQDAIQAPENCPQEKQKIDQRDYAKLELELWEDTQANRYLKDLVLPAVVLSMDSEQINLGLPSKFIAKIRFNYSIQVALDESVRRIVGRSLKVSHEAADQACRERRETIANQILKEEKEARIQANIDRQKAEGKCNIIPFPSSEDKIRTDLTLSRHAFFVSNNFKGDIWRHERRVLNRESGQTVAQKLQVGCPKGQVNGVLKQKHQEILFELFKIWEEQGYKLTEYGRFCCGLITLTVYELVKRLTGSDTKQCYERVFYLLQEMKTIPISIENAYAQQGILNIEKFSLLDFEWRTKTFDKDEKRPKADEESRVQIRFSSFVTESFLRKNIKQFLYGEYRKLGNKNSRKSGNEELLYDRFDFQLANKDEYGLALKGLPAEFATPVYLYKANRKQKIEPTLKRLNNRLIVGGKYRLKVFLRESADKKDWILVAKRGPVSH